MCVVLQPKDSLSRGFIVQSHIRDINITLFGHDAITTSVLLQMGLIPSISMTFVAMSL